MLPCSGIVVALCTPSLVLAAAPSALFVLVMDVKISRLRPRDGLVCVLARERGVPSPFGGWETL